MLACARLRKSKASSYGGKPMRIHCIVSVLAALTVAACQQVQSQVSSFNELPPNDQGAAFFIMPLKHQEASLEYRQYASRIEQKLIQQGYVPTNDIREAEYLVYFDYAMDEGKTVSGTIPLYGQTGGGTTYHSGTASAYGSGGYAYGNYSGYSYTPPTYGIIGAVPWSRTDYTRGLFFGMADLRKSTPEKLYPVYEATVLSTGSDRTFAAVADCLIEALFTDFRSRARTDETVTVPASECVN